MVSGAALDMDRQIADTPFRAFRPGARTPAVLARYPHSNPPAGGSPRSSRPAQADESPLPAIAKAPATRWPGDQPSNAQSAAILAPGNAPAGQHRPPTPSAFY